MVMEFLNESKKNLIQKKGSGEFDSLLPSMQEMISKMYSIPLYNFVTDLNQCPDLEGYNVHYDSSKFKEFLNSYNEKNVNDLSNNSMVR